MKIVTLKFKSKCFIHLQFLLLVILTGSIDAASFNCAKAKSVVEKLICSQQSLSALDDTLNRVYTLYQSAILWNDTAKQEQASWCKNVRDTCKSSATLERSMNNRISFFKSRLSEFEKTHGKLSGVALWRWRKSDDGTMAPWLIDTTKEIVKEINQELSEKCVKQEHDPEKNCKPTEVNATVSCNINGIFSVELAFSPDEDCFAYAHPIEAWSDYYSYDLKTGSSIDFQGLFKNWKSNGKSILELFVGDDQGGYYDGESTCDILNNLLNGEHSYPTPLFTDSGLTIQTQFPYAIRACSNTYTVPYESLLPYVGSDSPINRWKTVKK